MVERYEITGLQSFVEGLFRAGGLSAEMARVVSRGFLEADLLGFPSHGLSRVPVNLDWLREGRTETGGEPVVLSERPALANWDAHRLPGHWAMSLATAHAIARARETGVFTMTLRRCQHVACLAATLMPVVEARLMALMMASSPEEAFVSPFGGSRRLFSNNPLAFTAPSANGPILIDVSMAVTAGGQVARAARQGRRLAEKGIKTAAGHVTDDPAELARGGSVMPLGGLGHGHKGHALTVMTEIMSQALGGFGRARAGGESEENCIYLQVLDPQAFAPAADYDREVNHLAAIIEGSPPDDPQAPVRIPGRRAWRDRARQIESGVELDPGTVAAMVPYAAGLAVPEPIGERARPAAVEGK